jgi:hypothetical protein
MIKSRRMRWAGQTTRMGRGRMDIAFWWGGQNEKDNQEVQDVGGLIILKWILNRMGWYGLD